MIGKAFDYSTLDKRAAENAGRRRSLIGGAVHTGGRGNEPASRN